MFRPRLFPILVLCTVVWLQPVRAASPAPLPPFTPWDTAALAKAPAVEWLDRSGKVHAMLYTGEPYQGHATKVFAYYASPVTLGLEPASEKKFPAIVLVHGGGGQAFDQWVTAYAKRGYAAISMDLAGNWKPDAQSKSQRHPEGGPDQDGTTKFRRSEAPDKDQWTYHAVSNVLLAHSLIRSFPEVDAERTGVSGISWGGYLTCIVAGVDGRFKAACPIYGCGFLGDNSAWTTSELAPLAPAWREKWLKMWDPSSYVGSAPMKVFFVNGSNDFAYPLDSYMKTYRLVQSPKNIRIEPAMAHGHIFEIKEVQMFFDSVFQNGPPLPRVTKVVTENGQFTAEVESAAPLKQATLQFTSGSHVENKTRSWKARLLTIDGRTIRGDAPPTDSTAWYITVSDERDAMVSSEVVLP